MRKCKCCDSKLTEVIEGLVHCYYCKKCYAYFDDEGNYIEFN